MKLILSVLLALTASVALHAQDATAPQSWTASDGRVIEAKFIKLDGEAVLIEKDGKQFAVPFAKLNADSVALAKKLGGVLPVAPMPEVPTYDPAESGPVEPLWALPDTAFAELLPSGKKGSARIETMTDAGTVFLIMNGADVGDSVVQDRLVHGAALLDGHSGKVISQTTFTDLAQGTKETHISTVIAPDGRIVLCTVSWREEGPGKPKQEAQVHLRAFDPATGKQIAHERMGFDDGKVGAESAAAKWTDDRYRGYKFCDFVRNGNTLLLATPYFVVEIDTAKLTPTRISRVPNAPGINTRLDLLASGAVWRIGSGTVSYLVGNLNEDAYEIPPVKPGWQVKEAMRGPSGALFVASESADKKEAVFGAFDLVKKIWSWTKPDPGWAKTWSQDFSAKWIPIYSERSKETVLMDENGEVHYKTTNPVKVDVLPEGKALVLPMEGTENMAPFKKELLLVDCASGAVEATFTFHRQFEYFTVLIPLPGNVTLIADSLTDTIELSVADPAKKLIPPLRKLSVEIPKYGGIGLGLQCNGNLCVLPIVGEDGGGFYGIPLPKR